MKRGRGDVKRGSGEQFEAQLCAGTSKQINNRRRELSYFKVPNSFISNGVTCTYPR